MAVRRGFTLIEVLIALSIGTIFFAAGAGSTFAFMRNRNLDASVEMAVSYMRTAVARASQSEGNSAHGVSFANGQIVLFRGSSYAARQAAYDLSWVRPSYVTATGLTEVVFSKQSAVPSAAGDITLSNGLRSVVITVYPTGAISQP